jgi:MinD superfamily P-loop ATPase
MEIAVISGKGGTGKSSICAAFASICGNTVLADCDVDAANLYLLFSPACEEEEVYISGHKAVIDYENCTRCGLCVDYCRFDAIRMRNQRVEISEISCDGCFLCSRICPSDAIKMIPNDRSRMFSGSFRYGKIVYGRLAPGEENSGKLVSMARGKAAGISEKNSIEHIILDGPPGIGCPVISTITGATRVIIVTEPTISGLSDLKRAADTVMKFSQTPDVIINKYDLNTAVTAEIKEWCRSSGIRVAGTLPFDQKMVQAMVNGKTITEFDPEGELSIEIRKIWNNILKT